MAQIFKMFIEINPLCNLSSFINIRGEGNLSTNQFSFLISPKGLPYLRFQNTQVILFPSDRLPKTYNYIHVSFHHPGLKREYATVYFIFSLGSEIQIPKYVTNQLSKSEKVFITKLRKFILNFKENGNGIAPPS